MSDTAARSEIQERHSRRSQHMDVAAKIKTILVAVSIETPSSGVLDIVRELGRRLDATIVVFHVREWPFSGSEWVLGEGAFVEGTQEATCLLERVTGGLGSAGVRARGVVRAGRPSEIGREIVDAAITEQADLIVLGFHRHSLLDELLCGSVVRKVRRRSEVPVLTVPRHRVRRVRAQEALN